MRAERQGDFWNFGGIYRPVYLEALPAQYIDWTGIDANANGEFKADLHFGPGVKLGPTVVTAQVWDAQNQPVGAPFSSRLTDGPRDAILDSRAARQRGVEAKAPGHARRPRGLFHREKSGGSKSVDLVLAGGNRREYSGDDNGG
jgi:hypothetical protein